jgi:RimJ/RimL family protein N-acetyltransferase
MVSLVVRPVVVDEWRKLADIRLEALKNHPDVYASTFVRESEFSEAEWQDWLSQNGKCVFGLYDDGVLIGITGVWTHQNDPSGATAVFGASYIRPDYRRRGLSGLLYGARLEWALRNQAWRKVVVAHREGNEASRRANQKSGFKLTHKDVNAQWPDGTFADQCWYQLDLEELRKKQ